MNFGLRLDEILSYEYDVEGCQALHSGSRCLHCNEDPCPHCKRWGGRQRTEVMSMVDKKTKQAITSLIKELVAEAKPPAIDTSSRIKLYADDEGQMWYDRGQNDTIARFEQNLLKALEEV